MGLIDRLNTASSAYEWQCAALAQCWAACTMVRVTRKSAAVYSSLRGCVMTMGCSLQDSPVSQHSGKMLVRDRRMRNQIVDTTKNERLCKQKRPRYTLLQDGVIVEKVINLTRASNYQIAGVTWPILRIFCCKRTSSTCTVGGFRPNTCLFNLSPIFVHITSPATAKSCLPDELSRWGFKYSNMLSRGPRLLYYVMYDQNKCRLGD